MAILAPAERTVDCSCGLAHRLVFNFHTVSVITMRGLEMRVVATVEPTSVPACDELRAILDRLGVVGRASDT